MISGFKEMAVYLKEHAQVSIHPDTLRRAVDDKNHPLPVDWDGGFAHIEPVKLLRWREDRRGQRRQYRQRRQTG